MSITLHVYFILLSRRKLFQHSSSLFILCQFKMTESIADLEVLTWMRSDEFRKPRYDRDPRCHRMAILKLQQVLLLWNGHRKNQWGLAIVRTAYGPGSDELFQHALTLIGRIAQVWSDGEAAGVKRQIAQHKKEVCYLDHIPIEVDTRPNEELVRRYVNDVLEDSNQLDGASVATVREYFREWIASKQGTDIAGDMRFSACIMLDAETLAQLANAPSDFPLAGTSTYRSLYWVKLVEVHGRPEEPFRVPIFGGLYHLFQYWFDRNYNRREVTELMHRKNPDFPGVLCWGPAPRKITPLFQ